MDAVHSFKALSDNVEDFALEDFETMTMIASALMWRRHSGKVKLYADKVFADYVYENNLDFLWDNGIDLTVFEKPNKKINDKIFWAASKMDVMNKMKVNEVHMDIDFVAWENIDRFTNKDCDIVFSHYEDVIEFHCYLPKEKLVPPKDYVFNQKLDWTFPAINTSFICFKTQEAKDLFCKESIRYMENNETELPGSAQMVFAEQRLTAMYLKFKGMKMEPITTAEDCINNSVYYITHLGYLKKHLRIDHVAKNTFNLAWANKLRKTFPEYLENFQQIKCLKQYF